MCCTHDEPKRRESQRSRPRGATCVYHVTAKCDKTTTPRRKKPKGQKECSNNIRRPLCPVARNGLLRTCTQHTLHTSLLHLFLKVPVHINKISERLNLNQVQREKERPRRSTLCHPRAVRTHYSYIPSSLLMQRTKVRECRPFSRSTLSLTHSSPDFSRSEIRNI